MMRTRRSSSNWAATHPLAEEASTPSTLLACDVRMLGFGLFRERSGMGSVIYPGPDQT